MAIIAGQGWRRAGWWAVMIACVLMVEYESRDPPRLGFVCPVDRTGVLYRQTVAVQYCCVSCVSVYIHTVQYRGDPVDR